MKRIRVTVSAEHLIQSALDAAGAAGLTTADKGDFIVERLTADGYAIREADAPSKAEWNALMDRLEERDLHWVVPSAGEVTEGSLREGPEEPPSMSVVVDKDGSAWQHRSSTWSCIEGGTVEWRQLVRDYGPVTLLIPAVSS